MKLDANSLLPSLFRAACLSLACFVAATAIAGESKAAAAPTPRLFPSPTEAVQAFVDSLRAADPEAVVAVFGTDAEDLLHTGDRVQDRQIGTRFLALYDEKHALDTTAKDRAVLVIGLNEWPFPVPLVKGSGGWYFDAEQGREEIVNRRVGRNELRTIQTCLAVVDAEREYFMQDRDGDGILEYAPRVRSTEGNRDGLYWPTEPGEPPSPLGELAAEAAAEGYAVSTASEPQPYHGYLYKILTSQGKSAPGGAYDYMARGNMIGGFAVFAHPATYGVTGVMSFMVNQDGIVFQKDLGKDSHSKAQKITSFNPDKGWTKVPDKDLSPFPPAE